MFIILNQKPELVAPKEAKTLCPLVITSPVETGW